MRGRPADEVNAEGDLLASMIEILRENADDPPTELKGVPDSFLDELERVPKEKLNPSDTCPICVNPFLEGRLHITSGRSTVDQDMHRQISTCGSASMSRRSPL